MRYLISAMLAGLFLSVPAATLSAEGPPIPQDPERQEQRRRDMLAWNRRTLGEAYDRVGKKDPRWDDRARKTLDLAARVFSHVLEPDTDWVHLHNAADQAILFGCDDPLILYLHARASFGLCDPGPKELDRRYAAAAKAMEGSSYPPFRRCMALYKAAQQKLTKEDPVQADRQEADRLITTALDLLPKSVAEDEHTVDLKSNWRDAAWAAISVYRKLTGDRKAGFDRVDTVLAKTPALESLRLQTKGRFFREYAWEARGTGYANTVTEEGRRKFNERLSVARKALEEAWAREPGDVETANQMLWVELGQSHGRAEMEKWFDRAIKADDDNAFAFSTKLEWLAPRWYGTRAETLAFGRACRETKNWRAGITLLVAQAHYNVWLDLPTDDAKNEYMHRTDVFEDIFTVYTEYLKKYYTDHSARSKFALLCYFCGRHQWAHRQFLLLGNDLRWDWGYSEKYVKEIREFVAKYADEPAKEAAAKGKNADPPAKNSTAKAKNTDPPAKNTPAKTKIVPPADAWRTREFPAQNCRFTLPDKDWVWDDTLARGMLCAAQNAKGFTFILGAVRLPGAATTPEFRSAEEYEKGFYGAAAGEFTKRGGHFLTFDGLRCYQAESFLKDGRTSAHRALFADGLVYSLMLIGSKEPVEQDPDFEKLMSGFAFLKPPAQAAANGDGTDTSNVSKCMGQIAGMALFIALIVGAAAATKRKKPSPARRNVEDDHAFEHAMGGDSPLAAWNARQAARQAQPNAALETAVANYRKGMKDLGRGLVVLAILQVLLGSVGIAMAREWVLAVVLVALGVVHAIAGVVALRLHGWVNYALAIWATLLLAMNFFALSVGEQRNTPFIGVGMLIPGALLYYSIKNLSAWGKVKAAARA